MLHVDFTFMSNRVVRIWKSSHPNQWCYINTDHGTRPLTAAFVKTTNWFSGPSLLVKQQHAHTAQTCSELVQPDADQEVCPEVTTQSTKSILGANRFKRFSTWKALVWEIASLIKKSRSLTKTPLTDASNTNDKVQATTVIIKFEQDSFI